MSAYPLFRSVPRGDRTEAFWSDPVMPFVESRLACQSRACYKTHHHPTFSIGAIDEGSSVFTGATGGPIVLHPGTLVFVPATRVHACNPAPDKAWSYQMLHLEVDWLQTVREEYAPGVATDAEPIRIVTSSNLYERFCRLNALLFSDADACEKEAALIEFIGDSDSQHSLRIEMPRVPPNLAERLRPILERQRAAPAANLTLDDLARLTHMSRYQVIRAFRAVTGMTPHAWQLNLRVNLARRRIRDGDDISDVALHLGFADQAHFQREFKAHVGTTPGRFRS